MTVEIAPPKRVVIVDDSRTMRTLLEGAFATSRGFTVVGTADNAEAAAVMIRELRPDLVTIDLCMPYINGAALLGMLGGLNGVCKIVLSDHAAGNMAMAAKLLGLGAAACIGKAEVSASPVFLQKLRTIMNRFETSAKVSHLPQRPLPTPPPRPVAPGDVLAYPIPADEQRRLDYLRRKQLANATPERQFDLITEYVAKLTAYPMCLMTFIDEDTQWLKSSYGFRAESMPRCEAFCNHTIAQDDTFVVRDAANHEVFASYPSVVGAPHIRTYVGHPLITGEGIHVGALCVIDTQVRVVPEALTMRLKSVAQIAAEMINCRPRMAA